MAQEMFHVLSTAECCEKGLRLSAHVGSSIQS